MSMAQASCLYKERKTEREGSFGTFRRFLIRFNNDDFHRCECDEQMIPTDVTKIA